MSNTSGEKELKRAWPHTTGLTAETTKQEGRESALIPQNSLVPNRKKVGL